MKAHLQEVSVTVSVGGLPQDLYWQGRALRVQVILDQWKFGGRWWVNEHPRDCFLVQAGHLTAELHHELVTGGRWWLTRLQD